MTFLGLFFIVSMSFSCLLLVAAFLLSDQFDQWSYRNFVRSMLKKQDEERRG